MVAKTSPVITTVMTIVCCLCVCLLAWRMFQCQWRGSGEKPKRKPARAPINCMQCQRGRLAPWQAFGPALASLARIARHTLLLLQMQLLLLLLFYELPLLVVLRHAIELGAVVLGCTWNPLWLACQRRLRCCSRPERALRRTMTTTEE